jgi:ribose-phosphate pyrophosphokinase
MAGLMLAHAYKERRSPIPYLILPCIPGARQDRLNDTGDFLFTTKYFAKLINDLGFAKVVVVDPHSEVSQGMIDHCEVFQPWERTFIIDSLKANSYAAVVAPDAGAEKRAKEWSWWLGVPVIHAWKNRDIATGKITGFGHEPVSIDLIGKRLLVVDDICDAGGTFIGLGERLKQSDVTVDLFVTHGLFSKGVRPLLKVFERVFTTDTILQSQLTRAEPKFTVFDICQYLFHY